MNSKFFNKSKHSSQAHHVLKYFKTDQPVEIQTDASSSGLGAFLMQGGQPVQYASRALTKTEKRYHQIETEMLSVVFGPTGFHTYTYGRNVRVYNNHLLQYSNDPLGKITFNFRECRAKLCP